MAEPSADASDQQREDEDVQWSTVNGRSGGRRNAKAKYQSHHGGGARRAAPGRQGPPINMQQKLADVAAESAWFAAQSASTRCMLLNTLSQVMHRHIEEMSTTPFLEQIVAQINRARAAMAVDMNGETPQQQPANGSGNSDMHAAAGSDTAAAALAAGSAPLEIVIYGIGRFAEYAPPLSSAAAAASSAQLIPQQVRAAIRASSRSPQLQLAAILAVAQRLCGWRAEPLVATPADGTAAAAAASSSAAAAVAAAPASQPLIYMYDPMLSSLECSLATTLGVRMIPRNEEGFRPVSSTAAATLFYMPHCPQTLSDNVLAANWGAPLSRVMVIGNSLTRYAEQAQAKARTEAAAADETAAAASSGYLRASSSRGKKKPSAMASILAASPVCCDHDHGHAPSATSPAASASTAAPSPSSVAALSSAAPTPSSASDSPYPHLALISPWLTEVALANTHPSRTVFNDLSLHWFALSKPVLAALGRVEAAAGQGDAVDVDESTRRLCGALLQRPVAAAARTMAVSEGAVDAEIISAALTDAAPR